jgi:hypothetical protein
MASIKWEVGPDSTVLSTELNGLANDAQKVSAAIDNSSDLYLFDDVEWSNATLSYTPSAGAVIELYIIRQRLAGGANFEDGNDTIPPPAANLVGVFNIRSSTAAQTHILRQIPIPPDQFKYLVINKTGGALPSSGNTLRRKPLRYQTT